MLPSRNNTGSNEIIFRVGVEYDRSKSQSALNQMGADVAAASTPRSGQVVGSTPAGAYGGHATAAMRAAYANPSNPTAAFNSYMGSVYQPSTHERVLGNVMASAQQRFQANEARAAGYRRQQAFWMDYAGSANRSDFSLGVAGRESWENGRTSQFGGDGGSSRMTKVNESVSRTLTGVTELARGFAYLAVSGNDSAEKLVRGLVKVEAAISAVRGGMTLARGLQGIGSAGGIGGLIGSVGSAGPVGIAAGLAAVTIGGMAYLGNYGNSQRMADADERIRAIEEAEQLRQEGNAKRLSFMDYEDFEQGFRDTRTRGRNRRISLADNSLIRSGNREEMLRQATLSEFSGANAGDNESARGELERAKRLTEEINRIDEEGARKKLEAAQYVTREYQTQLRIEQERLRAAESGQRSGAAAWFMASPAERQKADQVLDDYMNNRQVSPAGVSAVAKLYPGAAGNIATTLGQKGFGGSVAARLAQGAVDQARADVGFNAGAARDAQGEEDAAEKAIKDLREKSAKRVDEIAALMFDVMDRIEARIEQRSKDRRALVQ